MPDKPAKYDAHAVEDMILTARGQKVILDRDLAAIYGVPTRRLNEQVKRNGDRFPADFVFRLTPQEVTDLISQFTISSAGGMRSQFATASKRNIRFPPYAFTEHGAIMAANVLNSNAILVGWTKDANRKKSTSQIVSFELGMAFSLGLPVYLLRFSRAKLPWFFDKLTDYIEVSEPTDKCIRDAIQEIEPYSLLHPVDLTCPRETYCKRRPDQNDSENMTAVQENGHIVLPPGFDSILHFRVCSRRPRPERDVRLILEFPPEVQVHFDPGSLGYPTPVQRNEIMDMRMASPGVVRMYWPSFPPQNYAFELHLQTSETQDQFASSVKCRVSSESLVGWRSKDIPLRIENSDE